MYMFIKDFLSDRKFQVRVGDVFSEKVHMTNGTPQGSIISPLLFNLMINDLPTPTSRNTEAAIFADESSAWCSGKNLTHLNTAIQVHIDNVTNWSENGASNSQNPKQLQSYSVNHLHPGLKNQTEHKWDQHSN